MTKERFEEIMNSDDDFDCPQNIDNVFAGLQILAKYSPINLVCAAEHDIIYSIDIDEIIEKGITEDDVKTLRGLNWMIAYENGCLSHFV